MDVEAETAQAEIDQGGSGPARRPDWRPSENAEKTTDGAGERKTRRPAAEEPRGLSRYLFKNPKRPNSPWYIRFWVNNRKVVKSTRHQDEKKALDFLIREMGKAKDQGRSYVSDESRVKFEDLVELIERDYRIKERRSASALKVRFKHLRPFFGHRRMINVTNGTIEEYRDLRKAEFRMVGPRQSNGKRVDQTQKFTKPASIDLEVATLKTMFRLAVAQRRLSRMPQFPPPLLKPNANAREGFMDKATFFAIRDQMPEDLRDPLTFLYVTGWRPNEVRSLEWGDIDLTLLNVDLRRAMSKTGEPRDFPFDMEPELEAIILRAKARRGSSNFPFVFFREIKRGDGSAVRRRLTVTMFRKRWITAAKRVGVAGMLVYDMRRSAVRNRRLGGVSDSVNMRLSGHKTRLVFDRYDITSRDDLREAVRKQRAFLDAQPDELKVVPIELARGGQLSLKKIATDQEDRRAAGFAAGSSGNKGQAQVRGYKDKR